MKKIKKISKLKNLKVIDKVFDFDSEKTDRHIEVVLRKIHKKLNETIKVINEKSINSRR